MSTPVVMPQMGESIAEGTIVRWIKKVGDAVDRDEPLFEISTDKVDAEIPAPAAGVLIAIAVKEGETVPVNSVVGTIGAAGEVAPPADEGAKGATGAKGAEVGANGAKGAKGAEGAAVRPRRLRAPTRPERLVPTVACARVASDHRRSAPAAQRTPGTCSAPAAVAAELRPSEVFAARAPHREGAQRRHRPHRRHGHRRPRHQAGHPRIHRRRCRPSSPADDTRDARASGRAKRRPTKSCRCR